MRAFLKSLQHVIDASDCPDLQPQKDAFWIPGHRRYLLLAEFGSIFVSPIAELGPLEKRQATGAPFLVVLHHCQSQCFLKIEPVVVVLEWPDHRKNFAWVLGHNLIGIVAENEANHLTFFSSSFCLRSGR